MRLVKESRPKEGSSASSCKCGVDCSSAAAAVRSRCCGSHDHARPLWSLVVPVRRRRSGSTAVAAVRGWLIAPVGRPGRRGAHRRRSKTRSFWPRELLREGPHVIGWALGIAASTVHAVLRRHGRSRLVPRPAAEEVIRYEYSEPGALIHVDIKKLGRILLPGHRVTGDRSQRAKGKAGWQYLFVAIDDHSRLGFAAVYPDETSDSANTVPRRARPLLRRPRDRGGADSDRQRKLLQTPLGRRLQRPRHHRQEDAALPAPDERESGTVHPHNARALGLRLHLHQRITNDSQALAPALDFYNRFRPHRALKGLTPLQRVYDSVACSAQAARRRFVS